MLEFYRSALRGSFTTPSSSRIFLNHSEKRSMASHKIAMLNDRAEMFTKARMFFMERGVREVDCPIISARAAVDAHIDLIPVSSIGSKRYLHSSPEYGMKRLLADGIGDIYQLSHVFREGESGTKHNPEFMMAEWYRLGFSFKEMIDDTVDFICLFLGPLPCVTLTYREAFHRYAGFDYLSISERELLEYLQAKDIQVYEDIAEEGKDALLNLVLGSMIEPHLGKEGLCVLAYYPASQAALAQTEMRGDEEVGERFEVYYQGVELANGYHELADPIEQRRRFEQANEMRKKMGKETLPIDEYFLSALEKGLPDCCGVAVGFDRLMMLRHKAAHIADVIPFIWDEA